MVFHDLTRKVKDFADTAAIASFMDVVVSVGSPVSQLAAGMGLRTWVLVPDESDWRHPAGRDHDPWYPTMRLFRPAQAGAWESAVERIAVELSALASTATTAAAR
jgi:hypothetical protein